MEMKRIDEFLQLSFYLKNYELYLQFLAMNDRHKQSIKFIDLALESNYFISSSDSEVKRYNDILKNLDSDKQVLENRFGNFDFSDISILDAKIDYELLSYEFIRNIFFDFIQDKNFDTKDKFVSYIYYSERVIKKYFISKFYVFDNLDKVFVKVIDYFFDSYDQRISLKKNLQKDLKNK